jgi:hypothetical protein
MRLVSLREPGVALSAIAPDSLGQPGFRATRAGRDAESRDWPAHRRDALTLHRKVRRVDYR